MEKICFKCGIKKPLSEFYKHNQMKDGYLNKCKECTKKDTSNNRWSKIEYYREKERSKIRNKKKLKIYEQNYRIRNPLETVARQKLSNAIRDGKIKRGTTCEKCGATKNIIAHHYDYTKPFDVIWLCRACHSKAHGFTKHKVV